LAPSLFPPALNASTQARVKMADMSEESQVVTNVINCVSIFYEKGASGNSFLRKEKFRAEITSDVSTVKALKQIVRYANIDNMNINFQNFRF
jgi:hypothetical protein